MDHRVPVDPKSPRSGGDVPVPVKEHKQRPLQLGAVLHVVSGERTEDLLHDSGQRVRGQGRDQDPAAGTCSLLHRQPLTDQDLSNEAFPFGTSREIDLGCGYARATRITYVGELGWELLIPADFAVHVYDTLVEAGVEFGLRHAGYHALNSLRLEKGYRSWGHDIARSDTPLEAGLSFAVAWDKPGGLIGQQALAEQREHGPVRRLVQFALEDPDAFAYHDEPIYRDGVLVGQLCSAAYAHTLGRTVGLGYVAAPAPGTGPSWYTAGGYEIEIATERVPARASLRPMYDPASERPRS